MSHYKQLSHLPQRSPPSPDKCISRSLLLLYLQDAHQLSVKTPKIDEMLDRFRARGLDASQLSSTCTSAADMESNLGSRAATPGRGKISAADRNSKVYNIMCIYDPWYVVTRFYDFCVKAKWLRLDYKCCFKSVLLQSFPIVGCAVSVLFVSCLILRPHIFLSSQFAEH